MESEKRAILVVGGTGYIGSHTVVQLLEEGQQVVIIDDLSNSSRQVLERIHTIAKPAQILAFHEIDMTDAAGMDAVCSQYKDKISCVIHFAGKKAVGESVSDPLKYYHNNLTGTINLLRCMKSIGCQQIIFSSSATVYGEPETLPLTESCRTNILNPYGRTKLMIEEILRDICASDPQFSAILLRYFNPVGAHPSGLIGEVTKGPPNNLLPYVAQVCVGKRPFLRIYGNDYSTRDGTGERDYVHVTDLAAGHLAALTYLNKLSEPCGIKVYNLGTGTGYTVLEVVKAMEQASGKEIPLQFEGRREGDTASCYADPSLAEKELSWKATQDLTTMCRDLWNFQSQNPDGY